MSELDHAYVEENDVIQAYLAGRLDESEREAFEAHYFACAICLENLETANDLREGMRQVAAEDIARVAEARVGLGVVAGLATLARWRRLALAGALLLLAALPGLWLYQRNRGLQRQLTVASTDAERQRAALETRIRSLEQASAEDRRRLAEKMAEERPVHEPAVQPPTMQPEVNVPLFLLAAVRSGDAGREPVNQIPLAATTKSVILTAELATVDFAAYRATLHDAGGKEIWKAGGLRPDRRDTLVLLLPTGMLPPGTYELTIEGAQTGGKWFAVAGYPFRVLRNP
jgi:hypothetical protein